MPNMPPAKAKGLQEMLNKVIGPKPPLKVDGIFGKQTMAALKEFQKKAGVKQTGEVDAETAPAVARAIKTGKIEKDQPTIFVPLGGGKYAGFTEKEWAAHKKKVSQDLMNGPVRELASKVVEAEALWDHFNAQNKDQYVVSFFVELTRWTSLPSRSVIDKALRARKDLESLAKAADFQGFARRAPSAAKDANEAIEAMRAYRNDMIDGSGNWVTGLEATKWASFTALSVYFAPLVGAQLGASAVATAVVGGAAVKATESAAGEVGNWVADNAAARQGGAVKRVLVDAIVGGFTGFLSKGAAGGKSIAEAFTTKVVTRLTAKMAASGLGKKAVESIATYFITEGGKKVLEGAVADAGKAIKGDAEMTIEKFLDNVSDNFVKGCALGPFNVAFKKLTEGKGMGLQKSDQDKLRAGIMMRVNKSMKGETIHIKQLEKLTDEAMKKLSGDVLGKALAKGLDKAVEKVMPKLKGEPSATTIEAELKKEMVTPAVLDDAADEIAKSIEKDLKKQKK